MRGRCVTRRKWTKSVGMIRRMGSPRSLTTWRRPPKRRHSGRRDWWDWSRLKKELAMAAMTYYCLEVKEDQILEDYFPNVRTLPAEYPYLEKKWNSPYRLLEAEK